ncbi:MAG: SPFH domain-containing protein [Nannocystaceae bacterium]
MERLAKIIVLLGFALVLVPMCTLSTVPLGYVGVRSSNMSGVLEEDLAPGWHLDVAMLHRTTLLPSSYQFLDYIDDETSDALTIRTQDNNNVSVDVTVPYRIIPGQAHSIMVEGNHVGTGNGSYRFQRLAEDTTVSVLREELAVMTSANFYNTELRLKVAADTLERLNKELEPLHLQAETVLIRSVTFRPEYEEQLQAIQLNEQNKLLDGARERVAKEQQQLDNYELDTNAKVASLEQEWNKKQADLERAYQVGFINLDAENPSPGQAREALAALSEEELDAAKTKASEMLAMPKEKVEDPYLLGIASIQAQTLAYRQEVTAEADGIAARLKAMGAAEIAAVRGDFEAKLNALLGSPAGRAYVAWKAAENVTFASTLTFQSDDGIPSVLRLREFAREFMGNAK